VANGPAFEDAVTAARIEPNLSVGCHVVLVDGTPVLPQDASYPAGRFVRQTPNPFLVPAFRPCGRARHAGGFDAINLVSRSTMCPAANPEDSSHRSPGDALDTHKHAHVFPEILAACLRAARICGVRAIRNPIVPRERRFRAAVIQGQARTLEAL